jgi:hypothetical protein
MFMCSCTIVTVLITLFTPAVVSTASLADAKSAPPVADCIGLRLAITDKGLKYAASVATPLLEKELSSFTLPDLPFDEDGFEGSVSSISCSNFVIGSLTLNANDTPASTVALSANGVGLSCKANWNYKLKIWPHVPDGHGTVDITIGDSSAFSGTMGVSNNTGTFTSLSLPACTSNVAVSGLHFSGGLSGDILNLFKSLIKKTIQKEVNGQVCGAVQKALVTDLNPILAKPPANYLACTVLGKSVVCDISAGATPPSGKFILILGNIAFVFYYYSKLMVHHVVQNSYTHK